MIEDFFNGPGGMVFTVGFSVFLVCVIVGLMLTRRSRRAAPAGARLRGDGEAYELRRGSTRIGRDPGNDIVVPHDTVSTRHAVIETSGGGYRVRDLGSGNGTFVNGTRLGAQPAALHPGDRLRFDLYEFTFECDAAAAAEATRVRVEDPADTRTLVKPAEDPADAQTLVKPEKKK
jgi:pSer/pThr/pTyr-binding forkhead associated (FHA) protein